MIPMIHKSIWLVTLILMGSFGIQTVSGAVALYDSVVPVGDVVSLETLKKDSWVKVENASTFKGDAVLVNKKIAAVIRKDGSGIDLYTKEATGWVRRSQALPLLNGKPVTWTTMKADFNGNPEIVVEVSSTPTVSIRFGLNASQAIFQSVATGDAASLRILASCRFGIMPDFFASDMMIDARNIPIAKVELPSESIYLHMAGDKDAIVVALWDKNEKDITVHLEGEGDARRFTGTDIFYGKGGGKISVAILAQPRIWFHKDFALHEETVHKGVKLDWVVPYLAKWKGNFTREDKRIESIAFTEESTHGSGTVTTRNNKGKLKITVTMESRVDLPTGAWDPKGVLKQYYVGLVGPAVFYPLRRLENTPMGEVCIDDFMREALGTGPCETILDSEGKKSFSKGIFTCSYRRSIGHFFGLKAGRSHQIAERIKEERYFLRRLNRNMLTFVKNVQDRINIYVAFGDKMLAYIDDEAKKDPALADFATRIREEWDRPVFILHAKKDNYMISNNENEAKGIIKDFEDAIKLDTPEQAKIGYMTAHTLAATIGEAGDSRLRNMRRKVLIIRGMAAMEVATNPAASSLAKEIRKRTQEALRNPHSYEHASTW